jgi:hypothetical protein
MDDEQRRGRLRSFVIGGLVGASAALAAAKRPRPPKQRQAPAGLAAFEDAPCYRESSEAGVRARS